MKTIALISCSKTKLPVPSQARDLYRGNLFQRQLQYAEQLNCDGIYILSALHGLLELDQKIATYDVTLKKMPAAERKQWATRVLEQLNNIPDIDLENTNFVFLAGCRYYEYLLPPHLPHLPHTTTPLAGLRYGEQLQWLNRRLKE